MSRTMEALNAMAAPVLRGQAEFVLTPGRYLGLKPTKGEPIAAHLRNDRRWFRNHNAFRRAIGFGGSDEQTLCQLINWYRDWPRFPARVLLYWQAHSVLFMEQLAEHQYDGEHSVTCVLCHKHQPSWLVGGGLFECDWWALGKVIGPCCFGARCREKGAGA